MAYNEVVYFFRPYVPRRIGTRYIEPFDSKDVVRWMDDCASHKGYPMFRVRFRGGRAFFYEGKPAAYGICWDTHGRVPTVLFTGVPSDLWLAMAYHKGDWRDVLEYFEDTKQISPVEARRLEMKIRKVEMLLY